MIKKPWFVRLFGWLFWMGCAWIGLVWLAFVYKTPANLLIFGIWYYILLTLFCLAVWLLGSMFAWVAAQQQTRGRAGSLEAFHQIVRQAAAPASKPAAASLPLESWHAQILCESCKRYAVAMRCIVHAQNLCLVCAPGHDQADCVYVPARRGVQNQATPAAPAPLQMSAPVPVDVAGAHIRRERKKTVMTSPLGLASVE